LLVTGSQLSGSPSDKAIDLGVHVLGSEVEMDAILDHL
jgi:hypothetical protein